METKTYGSLIEVFRGSLWEAELVKGLLESAGVSAMLKDETLSAVTSPYSGTGGQVLVMVNKEEEVYAKKVADFVGKKVLCGATTADIIAREWEKTIVDSFDFIDPELPPISYMDGVDLITEGILTLTKVLNLLKDFNKNTMLDKGPAGLIVNMILQSDEIDFIVGTRINIAHQDPSLPVDLEIRRTVVKRIAAILEEKFLKEVKVEFI